MRNNPQAWERTIFSNLTFKREIGIFRCLAFTAAFLIAQAIAVSSLIAQAIVLPKDEILPELEKLQETYDLAFYVNGPLTVGLTDAQRETYYNLGPMHQLLMSLTTLRLVDKGLLSLDDSAAAIVPDILEHDPFKPAITIRHLLTNTGGFAAIPDKYLLDTYAADTLKPLMIQIRSAGQMPYEDLVGWLLLERALERVTNQPLRDLYQTEILTPLGLPDDAILWLNETKQSQASIFRSVAGLEGSGAMFAGIVRILIRNRSQAGRYLSETTYRHLTDEASWKFHPLAPARVLSLQKDYVTGHPMLSFAPNILNDELIAFPDQGVAFFGYNPDNEKALTGLAISIARQVFPEGKGNPDAALAQQLREPKILGGIYLKESQPKTFLESRISNIASNSFSVSRLPDNTLTLTGADDPADEILFFNQVAPYYYIHDAAPSTPLVFSPKTAGGYFTFRGETYRYTGLVGDKNLVIYPVPWMFLILITALIYIPKRLWQERELNLSWHRLGMFGVAGIILLALGLYGELVWWPKAVYEMNQPWLVFAWRVALNIGLMAILTIPLFTLSITKRKVVPSGVLGLAMNLHLVLLTAASLMLFFMMVAWGVAGEFWPY